MRKNRLIALIGTLTMAAAGLAAVSAGVSSKKATMLKASSDQTYTLFGDHNGWNANDTANQFTWSGSQYELLDVALSANNCFRIVKPSDTNMQWAGWSQCKDTTNFESAGSDNNIKTKNAGRYNFYFKDWEDGSGNWNPIYVSKASYSVTLNKNGGSISSGSDITGYQYGETKTLPTLTKSGCTFNGWYDNETFTGSPVTQISATDHGNKEFWAKFTDNKVDPSSTLKTYYVVDHGGISESSTFYVYGFGEPSTVKSMTWPGKTGSSDAFAKLIEDPQHTGQKVYKVDLSESYSKLILNNNSGKQTINIEDLSDHVGDVIHISTTTDGEGHYNYEWLDPEELDIANGYWVRNENGTYLTHLEIDQNNDQQYKGQVTLNAGDQFKIVNRIDFKLYSDQYYGYSQLEDYNESARHAGQLVEGSSDSIKVAEGFGGTYTVYHRFNYDTNKIAIPAITVNRTVTFSVSTAGFGTVSSSSISVADGSSISASNSQITIDGKTVTATASPDTTEYHYEFTGWSKSSGTITSDTTITANFTRSARKYTVTLNPASGSGGSTSVDAPYGSAMPSITIPTRTGYTFGGYYTGSSGTGNKYYDAMGESAHVYDDASVSTLYAQWTPTTYDITYNTNNGTLAGTYPTSYNIETPTFALPATWATKPSVDKIFDGWFTKDGTGDDWGSQVTQITLGSTGAKEFYAKWSDPVIADVTVTYHDDGGDHPYVGKPGDPLTPPAVASRTGNDGSWSEDLTEFPNSDKTINAVYTPHKHSISYNGNGATSGSVASTQHSYGVASALSSSTFSRTGYTQDGWATSASGNKAYDLGGNYTIGDADVELFAHWEINSHLLTWNANGGSLSGTYTSGTVEFGKPITEPTASKQGYTFTGWNNTVPSTMPDNDLSFVAQWTENTVTVNFHGGTDVSGSMSAQTIKYSDASKALNANAFSKTGHSFAGWATSEGGEVIYVDEASISPAFTQTTETIDLYAVWDVNQITITFENTDERGGSAVLTRDYGTEMTFSDLASFGITDLTEDPLGRTYVGLKTDPKASEVSKAITFDGSVNKYYICYAFDDASAYQYSFDGVNYFSFAAHRDAQEGEANTLQDYYVEIAKVTAGDKLYVKYNGDDVTLSPDGKSNISLGGKVNNTAENVYLDLRLIYKDGTYSYMPVLGGMPVDTHCVSVDGILHGTTGQQQTGSDLWEWKAEGLEIAPGQSVDAYYNVYYQFARFDGNGDFFDFTNGKAVCKAEQTLTYNVYIKETSSGQANAVYIGLTPESEALLFAQEFMSTVGTICPNTENINAEDRAAQLEALETAWGIEATNYGNLSDAAKAILVAATGDEEGDVISRFASLYDYTVGRYNGSSEVSISAFMTGRVVPSSARNRIISISDVSTSTWIIASVAIVGIAAVGVFFIYRKRKEN